MKKLLELTICLFIMILQLSFRHVQSQTALLDRQKFKAADFVFDFNKAVPIIGEGGSARTLFLESHPVLKGTGVSSFTALIYPCGIVPPHLHPRFVILKSKKCNKQI